MLIRVDERSYGFIFAIKETALEKWVSQSKSRSINSMVCEYVAAKLNISALDLWVFSIENNPHLYERAMHELSKFMEQEELSGWVKDFSGGLIQTKNKSGIVLNRIIRVVGVPANLLKKRVEDGR